MSKIDKIIKKIWKNHHFFYLQKQGPKNSFSEFCQLRRLVFDQSSPVHPIWNFWWIQNKRDGEEEQDQLGWIANCILESSLTIPSCPKLREGSQIMSAPKGDWVGRDFTDLKRARVMHRLFLLTTFRPRISEQICFISRMN